MQFRTYGYREIPWLSLRPALMRARCRPGRGIAPPTHVDQGLSGLPRHKDNLSTRLDAGQSHSPLPDEARVPVGVVHPPKPKTRCDVSELLYHASYRIY